MVWSIIQRSAIIDETLNWSKVSKHSCVNLCIFYSVCGNEEIGGLALWLSFRSHTPFCFCKSTYTKSAFVFYSTSSFPSVCWLIVKQITYVTRITIITKTVRYDTVLSNHANFINKSASTPTESFSLQRTNLAHPLCSPNDQPCKITIHKI